MTEDKERRERTNLRRSQFGGGSGKGRIDFRERYNVDDEENKRGLQKSTEMLKMIWRCEAFVAKLGAFGLTMAVLRGGLRGGCCNLRARHRQRNGEMVSEIERKDTRR